MDLLIDLLNEIRCKDKGITVSSTINFPPDAVYCGFEDISNNESVMKSCESIVSNCTHEGYQCFENRTGPVGPTSPTENRLLSRVPS